jgi:hypothetical protein
MLLNSCDCPKKIVSVRSIRGNRRSVTGVYAFRGDTPIEYKSTLERDFLIRQEFFLDVLDVIAQPCQIPFSMPDGRSFTYTPDYLVYYRLGDASYDHYPKPMLTEIKPQSEWRQHWRKWLAKWKAAHRHAAEQGWQFHIHDESRIRDQSLINIVFVQRYRYMEFSLEETNSIVESVREVGAASFDHLLARHCMGIYRAQGISHLWHLMATRQLDCDMSQPLNQRTELWVPENGR